MEILLFRWCSIFWICVYDDAFQSSLVIASTHSVAMHLLYDIRDTTRNRLSE